MSTSPVPLMTRRVGQRCTLNLSRAETLVGCHLRCHPRHLTMVQNDVAKGPHVAEQCDVNIHSLVILYLGQVTRRTLESAPPSPNFHADGRTLSLRPTLHGGCSVVPGLEIELNSITPSSLSSQKIQELTIVTELSTSESEPTRFHK
ncbi:hypothetical protein TNCV_516591 [Trichonephila clavipes]|nr:hypothetical protein TNCV_516591 [Trichonephila clavipes]